MGKKKKKKKSSPVARLPNISADKEMKEEIDELQKKRDAINEKAAGMKEGKGFFKRAGVNVAAGIAKMRYNQQINARRKFIGQGKQIQSIKRQTELEKAKAELNKAKQQNQQGINFNKINADDMFKMPEL